MKTKKASAIRQNKTPFWLGLAIGFISIIVLIVGGAYYLNVSQNRVSDSGRNSQVNNTVSSSSSKTDASPSDFPVYPSAKVTGICNPPECTNVTYRWETEGTLSQVTEWYINNIPSGWECDDFSIQKEAPRQSGASGTNCKKDNVSYDLRIYSGKTVHIILETQS